jgi:hypothetical protein
MMTDKGKAHDASNRLSSSGQRAQTHRALLANFILLDQRSLDLIRYDQRVSARVYLARILWLQGFPDEAIHTAKGAVDAARESNHALSLCYALLGAAWAMLWVEDLAAAERYIVMLLDHSARLGLALWRAWVRIFQEVLVIRRYDFGPGLRQLRAAFDEFGSAMSDWISAMFLTELAAGFARAGQIADGLAAAEQAIERAEQTEARWLFPESLRITGELLLSQAAAGAARAAEDYFWQAIDWARRQDALSWELRAATSLARPRRRSGSSRGGDGAPPAGLQPLHRRLQHDRPEGG